MNLQKLFPSNTFEESVDKINKNFDEININGGGSMGPTGPAGPTGVPGGPGIQGVIGPAGTDGITWTISNVDPTVAPSPANAQLWLNYSTANIFSWDGAAWINNGTFGSTNFFYKSGTIISHKVNTDTFILSDEAGVPYNTATNSLNYLMKINSTNGLHMIFTDLDANDSIGTSFTLDGASFNIIQGDATKNLNLSSSKDINLIAANKLRIVTTPASNGTHFLSRVGISESGTAFSPTEGLQIGNPNGINTSTFSIELGSTMKFKGTGPSNTVILGSRPSFPGGTQYLPQDNGVLATLKDFNVNSFSEEYITWRSENQWGWCPDTTGAYSFITPLLLTSVIVPVMSAGSPGVTTKLFETSLNTNIGMYNDIFVKWKIINTKVHVIWNVHLKFFYKGSGGFTPETLTGVWIKLPYNIASNVSIQARSPYRIDTMGPNYFSKRPRNVEIHNGASFKKTGKAYSTSQITYQFVDVRYTANAVGPTDLCPFTNTDLYFIDSDPTIIQFATDGNEYNHYNYSGECFLDIAEDNLELQYCNTFDSLVYPTLNKVTRPSNGVPYGTITFWIPTNNDQYFNATGLGVFGDMKGWAICDGRNGTIDMRQRVPFGAEQISNNAGILSVVASGYTTSKPILGTGYTDPAYSLALPTGSTVTMSSLAYASSFNLGGGGAYNLLYQGGVFIQKII